MKIKLNIEDRLTILNILTPQKGDFFIATNTASIRGQIKLLADEVSSLEIGANGLILNMDKIDKKEKEYEFSDKELDIIRSEMSKLNRAKELPTTVNFINLTKKLKWTPKKSQSSDMGMLERLLTRCFPKR